MLVLPLHMYLLVKTKKSFFLLYVDKYVTIFGELGFLRPYRLLDPSARQDGSFPTGVQTKNSPNRSRFHPIWPIQNLYCERYFKVLFVGKKEDKLTYHHFRHTYLKLTFVYIKNCLILLVCSWR